MRPDRVVIAVATPIGAALLYILTAGEVSGGEAVACALVVLIACLYATVVARTATAPLLLSARGVGSILRALGAVPRDLWRVSLALAAAVRRRPDGMAGTVTTVPFRFGAFEASDIGRRAAVVTALSLAPNAVALGMDHERDELVLHQLVPDRVGGDREWPL